jgi:hypothetical protein
MRLIRVSLLVALGIQLAEGRRSLGLHTYTFPTPSHFLVLVLVLVFFFFLWPILTHPTPLADFLCSGTPSLFGVAHVDVHGGQ